MADLILDFVHFLRPLFDNFTLLSDAKALKIVKIESQLVVYVTRLKPSSVHI